LSRAELPDGSGGGLFDVAGASDDVIASFPVFMFEGAKVGQTPMLLPGKGAPTVSRPGVVAAIVFSTR
jgi:bifunctional ADP-heptose synthase (sugar kinase/adenylyltransferase)